MTDPRALQRLIGPFHYDSERSRREADFRIQIRPASWEAVKALCHRHGDQAEKSILDRSPERELAEEFGDTLGVTITRDQYRLRLRRMILEDRPRETENVRAPGLPTVRIYYVFDAWVESHELTTTMLAGSRRVSDEDLRQMAWNDARQGGRGRANAVLALRLEDLKSAYRSIPADRRGGPMTVMGHQLDGNVLALLDGLDSPYDEGMSEGP